MHLVSGWFFPTTASGVRCGKDFSKADALAIGEALKADTPGQFAIRCSPSNRGRIIATNLFAARRNQLL